MFRLLAGCAAALILAWSGPAVAGTTDIQVLRTEVVDANGSTCGTGSPIAGEPPCIAVVVKNLGPDPYDGSGGGGLQVSVDIDEPSKPRPDPEIQGCSIFETFAVSIAPGDSARLDFGVRGACAPTRGGTHSARATATAQGSNNDPVTGNNSATTTFTVAVKTPLLGAGALLVLAVGATWIAARRRRASSPL
jgi:hypothetical protein